LVARQRLFAPLSARRISAQNTTKKQNAMCKN
jgi:hypothetical protein